jgi:hypothetical protein
LGVGLSSVGVYRWSWFSCSFFSWNEIQRILVHEGRELVVQVIAQESRQRPANPEEDWVGRLSVFRRANGRILAGYLSVDPATAYYMLHHYLQHPELRHELGTQAGVERISTGDLG